MLRITRFPTANPPNLLTICGARRAYFTECGTSLTRTVAEKVAEKVAKCFEVAFTP